MSLSRVPWHALLRSAAGRQPASECCPSINTLHPVVVSCQAAALHAAIRDVCWLASEVEADAERFPQDWLFHYR